MQASKLWPLGLFFLFVAAAYLVIGVGPSFIPFAGSFDRLEPAICKIIGAILLFGLAWLFIRRDQASQAMLGLRPSGKNLRVLFVSSIAGGAIILVWLLVLRLILPFHIEAGALSATGFGFSVIVYLFGSVIEELAFRGYPFLRLRRPYGVVIAVAVVSIAFGFFHVPGLQGLALAKVAAITAFCSVIFCLGFLRTGTLWAAIGLHAGMNLALHSIFGAGDASRASLMRVVPDGPSLGWDPWFWSMTAVLVASALMLALCNPKPRPIPAVA
jgi:membrane protease YdiL (CAAX protease family)